MPNDTVRMDPAFEHLVRSYNFVPDNRHSQYVLGNWRYDLDDPLLRYWRRQERIEEGDTILPYILRVTFRLGPRGLPLRMVVNCNPMLAAYSKSYQKVSGGNKIIVYFNDIVQTFVNMQKIYHTGSRDKSLQPVAKQILAAHANRQQQ